MTNIKSLIKKNCVYITAAVILLTLFTVRFTYGTVIAVSGLSMYPTFNDGDFVFGTRVTENTELKDGDIVIANVQNKLIIKRVYGTPGETIENTDINIAKTTLGEDEYYLVGDNYEVSYDSRYLGAFSRADIVYKYANMHWTMWSIIGTVAVPTILFLCMLSIAMVPGEKKRYTKIDINESSYEEMTEPSIIE